MGERVLIDTNAIIDYLEGHLPRLGVEQMDEWLDQRKGFISVIVKIELLSFDALTPEMLGTLNLFIGRCTVLPLSDLVVDKTIELRKTYKKKLPDTIIATTALVNRLTLISRNESDFRRMAELRIVNLHAL